MPPNHDVATPPSDDVMLPAAPSRERREQAVADVFDAFFGDDSPQPGGTTLTDEVPAAPAAPESTSVGHDKLESVGLVVVLGSPANAARHRRSMSDDAVIAPQSPELPEPSEALGAPGLDVLPPRPLLAEPTDGALAVEDMAPDAEAEEAVETDGAVAEAPLATPAAAVADLEAAATAVPMVFEHRAATDHPATAVLDARDALPDVAALEAPPLPPRHAHVPIPSDLPPPVPQRVEFAPRRALRRLLGALVVVTMIGAAIAGGLAWRTGAQNDAVVAGILGFLAFVLASIRASINPIRLIINAGQLYVSHGPLEEVHDLTSRYIDVEVEGDPATRHWAVVISRYDAPTRRITHDDVDGVEFVKVLRYWRPSDLD